MKSNNEREFKNHFQEYFNFAIELTKLRHKIDRQFSISSRLRRSIDMDIYMMPKSLLKTGMLIKHGKRLLNYVKNTKLLLSKKEFYLDSQIKIVDNMNNIAKKLTDKNKRVMVMEFLSLFEKKLNLSKKMLENAKESLKIEKKLGSYTLEYGKEKISLSNLEAKCNNLKPQYNKYDKDIYDYAKKVYYLNNKIKDLIENKKIINSLKS